MREIRPVVGMGLRRVVLPPDLQYVREQSRRRDELAAEIDPDYDHASWSENFPWTRLEGVGMPEERKPPFTRPRWSRPKEWREALGDGSFGGLYQRPDEDVLAVWSSAVEQLRERLDSGWPI